MAGASTTQVPEDIKQFTVTLDGTDVTDLFSTCQFFHSITTPAQTVKVVINDRADILDRFHPEANLTFSFNQSANADYKVVSVDNIQYGEDLQQRTFEVHGASQEAVQDLRLPPIQKSYQGQTLDQMVEDIYDKILLTQKEHNIEKTVGGYAEALCVPKMSPFQTLQFLSRRAVSETHNNCPLFFSFERPTGFEFHSLEYYMTQEPIATYTLGHSITVDPMKVSPFTVMSFHNHRKFEVSESLLQSGRGYNEAVKLNFFDHGPTMLETIKWPKQPEDNDPTTSYRQFLIPFDPYKSEESKALYVGERITLLTNLMQDQFEFTVPGNTYLMAGTLIKINRPSSYAGGSSSDKSSKKPEDIYFISDVTHTILRGSKFFTKCVAYRVELPQ